MNFPHSRIFLLFVVLLIGLAAGFIPIGSKAQNTSPQRLRVRVENNKLKPGDETKVIVEFLDMNYNQVVNDTKREIVIGQLSAGSKQTGGGEVRPERIWIDRGEWSGYATFVSNHSGRLFITADSKGLDSARTLVFITQKTASFLSQLFETVAYAANDEPFVLAPDRDTAKANNKDFATFQVSFQEDPVPGTTLKISTNLTNGRILYKGEVKGSSVAEIKLDAETSITEDIQITSATPGRVDVVASVDGRFSDRALIVFDPPRPSKILFDDVPKAIASDAAEVCVTARLYDESTVPVKADQDRNIRFKATKDSDRISFDPESVKVPAGQDFAETRLKLTDLPSGNLISISATSDPEIHSAEKTIPILSYVNKLMVSGPREVNRGQEAEFTIQLAKLDGSHCEADLARTIDLSIDGGSLVQRQLVIPKGQRQASIKYTAPAETGTYTLTALSSEIEKSTFPIKVVNPGYILILLSLLGSLVGGIARQLHKDASFERIMPRRIGRRLDLGLTGRLFGSLVGGLFFYWTLKLGLARALSAPELPSTFDLGTKTVAFFLGGIGGFTGTIVLDRLASWFMPFRKRQLRKRPPAPAV